MTEPFYHALSLRHPTGVTPVLVGEDALSTGRPDLSRWMAGRTVFVISSAPILALHGERLESLRSAAAQWVGVQVAEVKKEGS